MAKIVEVPGVGNVEFPDSMSDDDIGKALASQNPAPKPSDSPTKWSQKLGEGLPGFNRVTAAIQAAADPLIPGRTDEWGDSFTKRYAEHLRANQGQSAQTQREHPYASAALQTAGGVPMAIVTPAAKASAIDPRVLERVRLGMTQAAGAGAAYAAGDTRANDAEGMLKDAATGALVSAPVGGAAAGALRPVPPVAAETTAESTSALAPKVAEWAHRKAGERNIKAAGGIQSDIARARKQIGRERLTDIGAEFNDYGLTSALSTPDKTFERATALQQEAGREMGSVLKSADAVPEAATNIGALIRRVKTEILTPLQQNPHTASSPHADHGMGGGSAADQMTGLLEKYLAIYGNKPLTPSVLHEMRTNISQDLYGLRGNRDPWASAYKDALHDFRGVVSDEIAQGIERAKLDTAPWRAANRKYEVAARAEEFADKGMDRAHGNNWISPTEFLAGLAGAGMGSSRGGAGLTLGGVALAGGTALARRHGSGIAGSALSKLSKVAGSSAADLPGVQAAEAAAPAVTGAEAKGGIGAVLGSVTPESPLGLAAAAAGDESAPGAPAAPAPVQGEQQKGNEQAPAHGPESVPSTASPQGSAGPAPKEEEPPKHVHVVDKLSEVLAQEPASLGAFAGPLAARLRLGGTQAMAAYDYDQSMKSPEYRALKAKAIGDERLT